MSNPINSGFSFGQSAPTAGAGFPIGQSTANTQAQPGGFSFGATAQAPTTAIVNPTPTAGGFSFGSNVAKPTTAVPFGATGFGQAAPATAAVPFGSKPVFGLGQPQVTPAGGSLSLGQPATPQGGFSFGQAAAPSAGLTLGQIPTPASTSVLSQGNTVPAGGFSFSTPAAATTITPAGGFSLGQTLGATTTPALPFNLPAASQAGGLTLGQAVISSAGIVPSSGGFGLAKPAATGFSLGGATTTTGLSMGSLTTPGVSTGLNFGTLASKGIPGAANTAGLSFGLGSTTTTTQAGGFSFNSSTSTTGLFSSTNSLLTTSAATPLAGTTAGLGGAAPTTVAGAGLGGTVAPTTGTGQGGTLAKTEGKSTKETQLPQEIFAAIADFEKYKETERKASEENVRQSAAPFHKLGEDAKKMKQHILKLSNQHAQLRINASKLKCSVVQEAEHVEMSRRTQETPVNLQGANKSPEEFFLRLVRSFEERMTNCRNKIDEVERCSRINGNSMSDSLPQADIMEILKKEHESVKILAARIYTLHTQLLELYQRSGSTLTPTPAALFKPAAPADTKLKGLNRMEASVLRPCLGDINSGLIDFQNGQQRAKAMSLSAAPPAVPLTQTTTSFLGSANTNLFGNNSSFNLGSNSNATNPGFNFGNKTPGFGTANACSFSSPFGAQSPQQTGGILGSSFSNSSFGVKPFAK